ncbi:PaaI family thioesterase [Streptacidiphilus sp. PAMC 29251]
MTDAQAEADSVAEAQAERRALAVKLGEALRQAIDEIVCTEAPAPALAAAVESARELLARLQGHRRPPNQLASLDRTVYGPRIHSPAAGEGNPLAPPVLAYRTEEGMASVVELGRAYEGPPGFVHGGISAVLMDEMLGRAAVAAARYGLTAQLTMSYRRPVPLRTPLVLRARVTQVEGRRTTLVGTIATVADPGTVLVEAVGQFVQPRVPLWASDLRASDLPVSDLPVPDLAVSDPPMEETRCES